MGDRVAVIRKGMLQQGDTPQRLYERPVNLFVAGFIGSPAMNLLEAQLARSNGSLEVELGAHRLPVPADVLAARPALAGYEAASTPPSAADRWRRSSRTCCPS